MKKNIYQFLKRDILIYYGIVLGIYCFVFKFMIGVLGGTNMFLNVILILGFIFSLLLSSILTVAATYYYLKKSKDITILILAIVAAIATVLSLFGVQFISALMSLGSGSYFNILVNYDAIASGLGAYSFAFYITYLEAIYCLVLFLEMKDVLHLPKLRELYANKEVQEGIVEPKQIVTQPVGGETKFVASQPASVNTVEQTTPTQQPSVDKQAKKKKGLIIGIVIACIILLCGSGYFVYNAFFSSTRVNLVKSVELKLSGYDGNGYAKIVAENDYEDNDKDVLDFLSGVFYTIESNEIKNGELSNGQKVKVVANYSKLSAKRNNINVTNDTYEVEVKGLVVKYTDGTKIPATLLQKMRDDATKKIQDSLLNNSTIKESIEFDSAYFINDGSYSSRLIMVYEKTTETKSLSGSGLETTTKYMACYCSNIRSDYESESRSWFARNLYDNNYKAISKKEDVKAALEKSFYSTNGNKLQEVNIPK